MAVNVNQLIPESSGSKCTQCQSKANRILSIVSGVIIGALENGFYCYGKAIARAPLLFIILCLIFTGFCSIGIIKFTMEERPFKLWIPENSEFLQVMEWQEKNFPSDVRFNMAIYEADNVLKKEIILEMMKLHDKVAEIQVGTTSWENICAKVPIIATSFFGKRKKRGSSYEKSFNLNPFERYKRQTSNDDSEDDFDVSLLLPRDSYCNFLDSMEKECLENSLLEVFGYESDFIETLSQAQIIEEINQQETSIIFGFPTNFTTYLGKIEKDSDGNVIKAGAAIHRWFTKVNRTAIDSGSGKIDPGSSTFIDINNYDWEQKFIETVLSSDGRPESLNVHLMASTSFGTVSGNNIEGDTQYLSVGFGIVFVYIIFMLGKMNMVEQRPILSLLGLACVGLSIAVSFGLCSAFDITFGPVNNILPFLLLGLGVDDMFVVMQAWNNLSPKDKEQSLQERIGLTLKHAGVSITVTSVTDFVAFAIGSSTILPALRSFCLYAAVGIAAIYFFQATFFVACLSLDQRRLEDNRHGFFWCWKLKSWTPNECSQKEFCQTFFGKFYAKVLMKLPVKISVLVITAIIFSISAWGISNLRQEFNAIWFLPKDSYLYKFFMVQGDYYPSSGEEGTIYFGNMNIRTDITKIETLLAQLEENRYVGEVDAWYSKYKKYWTKQGFDVPGPNLTEEDFLDKLSQFLHSPSGSSYRERNFNFDGQLNCTDRAPRITASSIDFKYIMLSGSSEKITAMESVREEIDNLNFSGYVRPFARVYADWETDKVIVEELYRNMGLAMLVVFIVTLILIASLTTSLMVLLCVLMTLVDVGALMHWWGLTIDTVSCIDLVLAIGLCVDYAAHVGHTFMTKVGTGNERAAQTIATIGPAVLSGGFSTFLSFVFLSNSRSHVFITFFKIFFAVCLYGLFHGLVFLPVLLSLIGPAPYATAYRHNTLNPTPRRSTGQSLASNSINGYSNGGFVEKEITSESGSVIVEVGKGKPPPINLVEETNIQTENIETNDSKVITVSTINNI